MSVSAMPNGRLRTQVYDPASRRMVSAARALGLPRSEATFPATRAGRRQAQDLERRAMVALAGHAALVVTVAGFRDRWLTDPIFHERWKDGQTGPTAIHNRERTLAFSQQYGHLPLSRVDDTVVAAWIAGGHNRSTVPALRAMFNAAASPRAGRLISSNPFAALGLGAGAGNKRRKPPSIEQLERLVQTAWDLTPPSFAAYLEFAATSGARPGELDALRPGDVDLEHSEVRIGRQWNVKTRSFTTPKYGAYVLALTDRAEDVLHRMPRVHGHDRYLFSTDRGHHYTPSSRAHHWNRVRCAAGMPSMTLYLATRHFFGWYALNIAGLAPHVIATQLGHQDGGKLVRELYGHPDDAINRRLIREQHRQARVHQIDDRRVVA